MHQPIILDGAPRVPRRQDGRNVRLSIWNSVFISTILFSNLHAHAAQPTKLKWIRVSSDHFSVLTDAGDNKGREVALRFEQMRGVFGQLFFKTKLNMAEPLEIIVPRGDQEYAAMAPVRGSAPGFFIAGPDRNFIVLNPSEPESWRAVSHQFAHYFLDYNYPPTQPWFDEGLAEYFSSIHLDDKQATLGADPELGVTWNEDILGNQSQKRNALKSLTELLETPVWLSIPDLFAMHEYRSGYQEGTHNTLFYAQSWMVVHYLLNKNKLVETGTYFGLVQIKKLPVREAIQQAYGMPAEQLEREVEEYFKSLTPLFLALDASKRPNTRVLDLNSPAYQVSHISAEDTANIGTSTAQVPDSDALALVAEMELRLPEHQQAAVGQLKAIIDDPKAENAIAHRALGWAYMQKGSFDEATAELSAASQIDGKDPWVHYYLALMKRQQAEMSGGSTPGLPNMMQDLRAVVDWDPDFAEAYNMLAMARLEGGGVHSAMEAIKPAIRLSPRNETYLLNLARIDMAGKQWDEATDLLVRLKSSSNSKIASAARKHLEDLPTLKKYGVLPQAGGPTAPIEYSSDHSQSSASDEDATQNDVSIEAEKKSPQPDKRPVKFLKGMLIRIDCSHPPAAVLTFAGGSKTLRLRTADSKNLVLIGAEEFSCEWNHRAGVVNYKAGANGDGDLVSLEVH